MQKYMPVAAVPGPFSQKDLTALLVFKCLKKR